MKPQDQLQKMVAPERKDILNVGGFNDSVFNVINTFMKASGDFVGEVEKVEL